MLKDIFVELFSKNSSDNVLCDAIWTEIEFKYSHHKRYYHTLTHIQNLINELTEVKSQIEDWDTVLFSLFFHDIIYSSKNKNNEEDSAELAKKFLIQIEYPIAKIQICYDQIIATKTHSINKNRDTNLFTDADLSILGYDWEMYHKYINQIRKEYSIYPDFLYYPGRKKVLKRFLNMDKIFKTEYFYSKFEKQARLNIERELSL